MRSHKSAIKSSFYDWGRNLFAGFAITAVLAVGPGAPTAAGEDMTRDPGAARQWITNGMVHFRDGDFKRATECLERAIMFDPGNSDAQALLNEIMTIAVAELKARGEAVNPMDETGSSGNSAGSGKSTGPGRFSGAKTDADLARISAATSGSHRDGEESGAGANTAPLGGNTGFETMKVAASPGIEAKSTDGRRGSSLFGSFLGKRGRSGQRPNLAADAAKHASGSGSVFAPGSSFVSYKRDPRVSKAIDASIGGGGGFKLLSGYLEKPVDRTGAADYLASRGGAVKGTAQTHGESGLSDSSVRESKIEDFNEKGLAMARKNRFGDAIREFGGALELDPGNLVAMSNIALAYAYNDDLYTSIKMYRKIMTLTPPGSKYHQLARNMIDKLKTLI